MGGRDAIDVMFRWVAGGLGVWALVFGCVMPYLRSRAVAAAGQLELRATRPVARTWLLRMDLGLLCLLVAGLAALLVRKAALWEDLPFWLLWLGVFVHSFVERLAGGRPWELELRERGLVTNGWWFWAWDHIKSYRWEQGTRLNLIVYGTAQSYARCPVRPEQRDEVESVLRQRLPLPGGDNETQPPSGQNVEGDRGN